MGSVFLGKKVCNGVGTPLADLSTKQYLTDSLCVEQTFWRSIAPLARKFMAVSPAINCDNANQQELKEMRRRRYRAS